MSAKAFLLIEVAVGKSSEVVAALKEIEGVTSADCVTGPYDVIAVVEGERLDEIGGIVTGKIFGHIPGVPRIVSCMASKEVPPKEETARYSANYRQD
ncbi:hypothetical protein ES703_25189 [subsurface metagenome]